MAIQKIQLVSEDLANSVIASLVDKLPIRVFFDYKFKASISAKKGYQETIGCNNPEVEECSKAGRFQYSVQRLDIFQGDDLKTSFSLSLPFGASYELVRSDGIIKNVEAGRAFEISYAERITRLNVTIDNSGLTVSIPIVYHMADVQRIDREKKEAQARLDRQKIVEAANVSAKSGFQLINIYFDLVNADVTKVQATLYLKDGDVTRKIGIFESVPDCNFVTISDLVPSTYSFEITQYSSDGNEIFKSPMQEINVNNHSNESTVCK